MQCGKHSSTLVAHGRLCLHMPIPWCSRVGAAPIAPETLNVVQALDNKRVLIVAHENITNNYYPGNNRSCLVSNCLFRVGGAACLMSNRCAHVPPLAPAGQNTQMRTLPQCSAPGCLMPKGL